MDTAAQEHTTETARHTLSAARRLFAGPGETRARARALDWSATPLGAVEDWSPALRTLVRVVMAAGVPSALLWGRELAFLYNDACISLIGAQHPGVLGRRLFDAAPETRDTFEPLLARVRAGETVSVADVPTTFRRHAADAPATTSQYTFSFAPVRESDDPAGPVVGIHVIVVETTAQVALRESEARYHALFEEMDEAYAVVEVIPDGKGGWSDFRFLEVNPAFMTHTAMPYPVGRTATELLGTPNPRWAEVYGRVAETGESVRFEEPEMTLGRDFDLNVFRLGGPGSRRVAVLFADVTERKRAAALVRAAGARDAYRVELTDGLRRANDPVEAQAVATRLLGDHLGVSRVMYGEADPGSADFFTNQREYRRDPAMPTALGTHRWNDFGDYVAAELRAGRMLVVDDVNAHPGHSAGDLASYEAVGIRAYVAVPLVREGQIVAYLAVNETTRHRWTDDEVALIAETAERTWAAVERARAEATLRHSEARYRLIVEGARDYAILTIDPGGRITSWSPGAEAIFGWAADEVVGQPFALTFVPADRASGEPERELATAAERGVASDVRWHQGKDSARVFMDGTTRALHDERGRLSGFLKVGQDVTRRRAQDEALQASEARYRTLVENVCDYAIFLLDARGVVTEWTPGAERVKGYSSEEVLGRHLAMFFTPEDVAAGEPARELAEAAETGRAEREGWRVRKGGERFWVNEIATAVRDRDGHLAGFTKISRDLTERRQAEEAAELVRAAAERDALRRRLARAEEDERRRLSRELHDEAGQHLTALALGLQALSDVAPADSEVDRRAAELRALASTLGRELHAVALRLRPRALDDFGLEAALTVYAEDWSRQTGMAAEVHARMAAERLPDVVESALYRIVQEALTNVARHSGATHTSILVERRDGHVVAVVEDDGCGFEPDRVGVRDGLTGLGLLGIRERATLLGGSLDVESTPGGGGTTLFVRIPIVPPDAGVWSADGGRGNDG